MSEKKIPQWVNTFRIHRGYESFCVKLGLALPDKTITIFEFLMHPKSVKGLAKALNQMVKDHEKEHGELPETELTPIEEEKALEKKQAEGMYA